MKDNMKYSDDEIGNFMKLLDDEKSSEAKKAVEFLQTMGMAQDAIMKLPPGMRQQFAPMVANTVQAMQSGRKRKGGMDDDERFIFRLKALKELGSGSEVEELRKQTRLLQESLWQKEKEHLTFQQTLIQKQLDELKNGKMNIDMNNLPQLLSQINVIRKMSGHPPLKDVSELVGMGSSSNLEVYKRALEAAGMKVSGPVNIEERLTQIQKETEEKIRRELQIEERRTQLVLSFVGDTLSSIMGTLGQNVNSEKGKAVLNTLSKTIGNIGSLIEIENPDVPVAPLQNPATNLNSDVAENVDIPIPPEPSQTVIIADNAKKKQISEQSGQ